MDHGDGTSPEASGEASGERSGEGRWLTYDDLSRVRGIGRESAVKLAQRKRWRRVRGNDGIARVLVPGDWLTPAKEPSGETSPECSPESSPEAGRLLVALETAIAALRERAEVAERRAEAIDADRRAAQARANQADADRRRLETERDAMRERAEERAKAAQAATDALHQAEAARKARGVLARLMAAWRG